MELVADRECDECTACCKHLTIETTGLLKLPNINCENLMKNGGCGIYQDRPQTCRNWYCAWRVLPELGNDWRPDKSGVMLEFSDERFPGVFANRIGFRFTIIDKNKASKNIELAKFLKRQILRGIPCLLAYGTEPAQNAPVTFLNIAMQKAASKSNPEETLKELNKAIAACEQQPKDYLKIHNNRII